MIKLRRLASLVVCGSLAWTVPVAADAVADWNATAVAAVTLGRPGGPGALDMALVQAAVHDAVQAIEGRFQPYHVKISGAPGSPAAAVAAAAYGVLVGCYPAQASSLTATYQSYLTSDDLVNNPGWQLASWWLTQFCPCGASTPAHFPPPFVGGTKPGEWRPTESFIGTPPLPPSFAPIHAHQGLGPAAVFLCAGGLSAPPSPSTTRQWKRDQGRRSSRLGTCVVTVSV